jgi:serine/threonine protein kinase/tetratricopeptide (TPR) repeat protein
VTLTAGTRLGRYEIRSKLGQGGMGEVYLAEDTQLHRPVAIKFLSSDVAQNRERLGRFEQEAFVASALNHPNILTVFEIGEADGVRFIATEYVDGETLGQRMKHSRISVREAVDIGSQVASALAAAHKAGVIHRDIKPENLMLRHDDSIVKVLDFGLAKASEKPWGQLSGDELEAATRAIVNTSPGVVMGTAGYMSPEQARGLRLDERTDIWSLGVVLYEMVAGRLPFEGQTASDVISMILHKEPPALTRLSDEATERLDEIVTKSLAKDREDRYQVAKDLLIDLRRLKQHLDFESEVERTIAPELRSTIETPRPLTSAGSAARTVSAAVSPSTSSAEYIVGEIKRHKKGLAVTGAVLVLVLAAAVYLLYLRRAPALTDKDTILLADFVNTTGDGVFDGTLRQALAVQLGQSPFLNIFPDQGVRETLRYMGRPSEERVTRDIGLEICQRQGIKAMLVGSISNLGSHYILTLEALNPRTGEAIAREQAEVENKEQVLKSLGQIASKLRQKLGESLGSVQKFDAPVEQATTSSLEALKAYSLGLEKHLTGQYLEAIPLYRRATELDPNFAIAYSRLGAVYSNTRQLDLASQAAQKAFDLRDRASERERFYIADNYYALVTQELEKDIETLELWKQTYPRDYVPYNNLALRCLFAGQFDKVIANASESMRLNPNSAPAYSNLSAGFLRLNRYDEASEVIQQALAHKVDSTNSRSVLYDIAFIKGDAVGIKQQLNATAGKPDEYFARDWQTKSAEFNGQLREAGELSARSRELAQTHDLKEIAARFQAEHAFALALFDDCGHAKDDVASALATSRTRLLMFHAGRTLALCGESGSLQAVIDELLKRWPNDSIFNNIWLPVMRAQLEFRRGNLTQAIQLLETTRRYEPAGNFAPQYLRGQAYLAQNKGKEAASEFLTILDHRGWAPESLLYPLAQLGLARAAALQGDSAGARKSYQDFFALWKDADPDIPLLIKAKKEYEQLK